ncbi:hypothetical protein RRG08_040741 [Elysia crispata]|uniref:Uncharacterized protein n=1 Tax=Elysia crispata TaxID=231223 RepID=A0AAE1BDE4_9GAST|nr:hypothetical protein RRG08_040741 [Elysia crispata]
MKNRRSWMSQTRPSPGSIGANCFQGKGLFEFFFSSIGENQTCYTSDRQRLHLKSSNGYLKCVKGVKTYFAIKLSVGKFKYLQLVTANDLHSHRSEDAITEKNVPEEEWKLEGRGVVGRC